MKYRPSELLPESPHYDVKAHLARVRELYAAYPFTDKKACAQKAWDMARHLPEPMRTPAALLVVDACEGDDIFVTEEPSLEYAPYLTRMQRRLTLEPGAAFTALERFLAVSAQCPAGPGAFMLPFADVVGADNAISCAFSLAEEKRGDEYLFPRLRRKLIDNLITASGYHPDTYDGKRQLIDPRDSTDPQKHRTYLAGTPFLDFFETPVPFDIPDRAFQAHGIILAPPMHGKTQLIGSIIAYFLQKGIGLTLLDPHGDLFDLLKDRVGERLVVLNPDDDPPPLNFLDFGGSTHAETLQTFSYLMSSLSGGMTDKQGALVPYMLKLLKAIPNPSLETLRQIVDEKVRNPTASQFWPYIQTLPDVDQGFFRNQFYSTPMQITKDAIGWKLYNALASDAFREMFSAHTNSFSADGALAERKVVLVKGSRRSLGEEGMKVFLQFITAQYFSAALRRERVPPDARHLHVFLVDEAHHVFNSQTSNILTECRKYGLGFIAATQVVQQIPEDVKAAIYGATAIKIAGPLSHTDASILAREMYTTPGFLRSMRSFDRSHAEWACYVSNVTPRAVKLSVPFGAIEKLPTRARPATTRRIRNIPEPRAPETNAPERDDILDMDTEY